MNWLSYARTQVGRIHTPALTTAIVACAGTLTLLPIAPASAADDPVDITAVPTEGDPMDLPGRGPAPKTKEENNTPAPVQSGARPEKAPEPREWFGPEGKSWLEWGRITGDWNGARSKMEEAGLTFAGSLRFDWTSVTSGGVNKDTYSRRLVDVNLTLELEKAFGTGWKGGTLYADFTHYGGKLEEPSGSIQGTDVIASPRHLDQLSEIWFQQVFADGAVRIKLGKIDTNAEFAVLPCACSFVSANGVWDANLLDMPTYPDPAFGGLIFYTPCDSFYVGCGAFDGATHDGFHTGGRGPATFFSDSKSDSWYFIGEAGVRWPTCGACFAGQFSIGGWYHTGDYDRFDGSIAHGTGGFYAMAQQQLTRRGDEDGLKDKGLFVFARAAFADEDISAVRTHCAAGLSMQGTFDGRDADKAGIMWSLADLPSASGASGDENLVELFYTIAATPGVSVTPYVQWVGNPSGDPSIKDATLLGVSVKVVF
ncbi:MAG: carbohydrate porin [Phycisphaerales bacterium]